MRIGDGFKTWLEFVLQETLQECPHGGDHTGRAFVANRLLNPAQTGIVKLDDLKSIAKAALLEVPESPKSG